MNYIRSSLRRWIGEILSMETRPQRWSLVVAKRVWGALWLLSGGLGVKQMTHFANQDGYVLEFRHHFGDSDQSPLLLR